MEPDKKFYLCPDCYRREILQKRYSNPKATRILTHIVCVKCGTQEYLPFLPEDPNNSLCRACYSEKLTEQKRTSKHPPSK